MDWPWVITIVVAVVFGAPTLFLTLRIIKKKKPVWAYTTTKIIGLGTDAPPELKLTYDGKPVQDVHRTLIAILNRGNEAIRKEDVTDNITIHFPEADLLQNPRILFPSKKAIEFSVKKVNATSSIVFDFKYLDRNDGAVIEVIHTSTENGLECTGNIIGVDRIKYYGKLATSYISALRVWPFAVIGLLCVCVWILDALSIIPFVDESAADKAINMISFFLFGAAIVGLLNLVPPYLRSIKFPRWCYESINVVDDYASTVDIPIESYCTKCRERKVMKDIEYITMKSGHRAAQGVCPTCNTKMFRILSEPRGQQ